MIQKRNETGSKFEKKICDQNGWVRMPVTPRIKWSGFGKNNFEKISSCCFNSDLFQPVYTESKFDKYDAINSENEKIEIKNYSVKSLNNWVLYSEPMFKIATKDVENKVIEIFGGGDFNVAKTKYNNFVDLMYKTIDNTIINEIIKSNIGIQCIDSFVPKNKLQFRWHVEINWHGFKRLSIQCKLID